MPDWKASMQQTFEYYVVDPNTWQDERKLDTVTASSISWDSSADTLGSATFDIVDSVGECYVRIYLITIQNGVTEKRPLGTFLIQTPATSFNGKVSSVSLDAYTPLLELKEKLPPLGYALTKGTNIMDTAYMITRDNVRAPVVEAVDVKGDTDLKNLTDDFVADPSETWISFLKDLIACANCSFELDEMGRVLFSKNKDAAALTPVWTYDDGNCSILCPDLTLDHDMYGIPNVVEVTYASSSSNKSYYARVVNKDKNSPISTVNRGREIVHRVSNPNFNGEPDASMIEEYANRLLRELSTLEYTISYTHGYCPVRVGDCVRFNHKSAGLMDVKAKVINQSVDCKPGCKVKETAIFTKKLWG